MPDNWYETAHADGPLLQGDFVLSCPTLVLPASLAIFEADSLAVERRLQNAVIMTQSCDLSSKGVETVLLCPYYPFKQWIQRTAGYIKQAASGQSVTNLVKKELESLAGGRRVAYHLLDKDEQVGFSDYQVVELTAAFSVQRLVIEQLLSCQASRIRLNSPYREHLSQAYATVFMRVGLPKNITPLTDAGFYSPD